MLRFRVNSKNMKEGLRSIAVQRFDVSQLPGKEGENTNLVVCECKNIDGIEAGTTMLGIFTYSQNVFAELDRKEYQLSEWMKIETVDDVDNTFTVETPRYMNLDVNRLYVTLNNEGKKTLQIIFNQSHYFSDENETTKGNNVDRLFVEYIDELGYTVNCEIPLVDYDYELTGYKSLSLNLEKMNESEDNNIKTLAELLINKTKEPYASFRQNYANQYIEDENGNLIVNSYNRYFGEIDPSLILPKRETIYFTNSCGFNLSVEKPSCAIDIPISETNMFGLSRDQEIRDIIDGQIARAINPTNDMERDMYYPVYKDKNGSFKPIYKIRFNLHFRERRGEDWLTDPSSYWNGTYVEGVNEDATLKLMNRSASYDKGFFSYNNIQTDNGDTEEAYGDNDEETTNHGRSSQSDLISYLNFTNNDIKYQKSKVKKSFIRLSCFDSEITTEQNLLSTGTIFLDAGKLFTKQIRCMEDEPYSMITYAGYRVSETKQNLVGAKVDREPYGKQLNDKTADEIEDLRLSSQFVVEDNNNSQSSSEGFYQYLWKDNYNGTEPRPMYMKVEFNHAGYGITTPFMMPYWDKKKWENREGIKSFQEIVNDWNDVKRENTDGPYGIRQYLKFSYIRFMYQYDKDNDRHVYYLDDDTYGELSQMTYNPDDQSLTINLYEAKIDDERGAVTSVANGTNDRGEEEEVDTNEYGKLEIKLSYDKDIPAVGGEAIAILTITQEEKGVKKEVQVDDDDLTLVWSGSYLDSNGNVVGVGENPNDYRRLVSSVTVKGTRHGKSATARAQVYQLSASEEEVAQNYEIGVNGGTGSFVTEYTIPEVLEPGKTYVVNVNSVNTKTNEWIDYRVEFDSNVLNVVKSSDGKTLTISVGDNYEDLDKTKVITLTQDVSNNKAYIKYGLATSTLPHEFYANPTEITIAGIGGDCATDVTSSLNDIFDEFSVESTSEGIENVLIGTTNGVITSVTITVKTNDDTDNERYDYVTFKQSSTGDTCTVNITVEKAIPISYHFHFDDDESLIDKDWPEALDFHAGSITVDIKSYELFGVTKTGISFSLKNGTTDFITGLTIGEPDANGNYKAVITYSENTDVEAREETVVLIQDETGKEITLNLLQYDDQTVILPNFDYLVMRYYWSDTDGKDLDTVTCFTNTQLKVSSRDLDYSGVGYGQSSFTGLSDYLQHGGDNTSSGAESALADFNNLCSEENLIFFKKNGIKTIIMNFYANWYNTKGDGNVEVDFIAYKGGTMSKAEGEYVFTNEGGTVVHTESRYPFNVFAQGSKNYLDYQGCYSLLGCIQYNIATQSAALVRFPQDDAHKGKQTFTLSLDVEESEGLSQIVASKDRIDLNGTPLNLEGYSFRLNGEAAPMLKLKLTKASSSLMTGIMPTITSHTTSGCSATTVDGTTTITNITAGSSITLTFTLGESTNNKLRIDFT